MVEGTKTRHTGSEAQLVPAKRKWKCTAYESLYSKQAGRMVSLLDTQGWCGLCCGHRLKGDLYLYQRGKDGHPKAIETSWYAVGIGKPSPPPILTDSLNWRGHISTTEVGL